MANGQQMYDLAYELFPICRSLTGAGIRQTLGILKRELPSLVLNDVPSGTKCFDWTVPDEWNIEDAYVLGPEGNKIIDFKLSNLHVLGYSVPIDQVVSLEELDEHLYSLPELPDAIPYMTSYYARRWGFCLAHSLRTRLRPGDYRVKIDSTLKAGCMSYGELIIPGRTGEEVLLSTYVCHPSMANNELSGPVLTCQLAKWIESLPDRRYTYRIVFIPETIGSICYLSKFLDHLKNKVKAGFNISCVGDDRCYSYLPSRKGNTLSDRVALHVLGQVSGHFKRYTYLDRGSDERQYCSPGVDLPVCCICRSKYGEYPEYHTSLDNMDLISPEGLGSSLACFQRCIESLEQNHVYRTVIPCEPQLGKRGLYPTIGSRDSLELTTEDLRNILSYSDGTVDLLEIAEITGRPIWELSVQAEKLEREGLLARLDSQERSE